MDEPGIAATEKHETTRRSAMRKTQTLIQHLGLMPHPEGAGTASCIAVQTKFNDRTVPSDLP